MSHTLRPSSSLRNDTGVSLVELLVVVLITGVLATVITMFFVNGLISQQSTTARDLATGRATVITETLADSIRNSMSFRVSSDGNRVDAIVLLPSGTPECRAWAINSADELVYSSGPTKRPANTSAWGVLADHVSGSLAAAPGTPPRAFSSAIRALDIGLGFAPKVATSNSETIHIRTTVTAQAKHESSVPACS